MFEIICKVTSLSRFTKQSIMIFIDSFCLISIILISYFIRLGYFQFPENYNLLLIILSPFIAIPIFIYFGLYRSLVRYIGFNALWPIFQAVTFYAITLGLVLLISIHVLLIS